MTSKPKSIASSIFPANYICFSTAYFYFFPLKGDIQLSSYWITMTLHSLCSPACDSDIQSSDNMLEKLFGSKLRARLLGWFFTHPDEKFFVRQLQAILQQDPANISRELTRLAKIRILLSEKEGNLKYYFVNKNCPFYQELKNLILKTIGIAGLLQRELEAIKGIKYAFI